MWKIDAMETLVRELKTRGYGLYICSNASIRLPSICMDVIPAAECFDGMLFSAEIKYLKPQKEIYEHLFHRFGLKPEECYFIDDLPMNIEGAKACGMGRPLLRRWQRRELKKGFREGISMSKANLNFDKMNEELLAFLDHSPSAFHATANMCELLKEAGYTRLYEGEKWNLEAGCGYYVTRNDSALIAFRIPKQDFTVFRSWQATAIPRYSRSKPTRRSRWRTSM